MKYKVNNEGIEALKTLKKELKSCIDLMSNSASSLSSAVTGNSAGAGPHYDEIVELTELIKDTASKIEEPVDEICENLEDLADSYEDIINRKIRAQQQSQSGSSSSNSGGTGSAGSGASGAGNSAAGGSSGSSSQNSGSGIPQQFAPVQFEGTVKVNGEVRDVSRKVYQRKDIDFDYLDDNTGLTNLERMQAGKPPIGADGNPIQLHHLLQQEPGPMAEILEMTHQEYYGVLHGLVENGASFRRNPILEKQYNNFRITYWKWRAKKYLESGK